MSESKTTESYPNHTDISKHIVHIVKPAFTHTHTHVQHLMCTFYTHDYKLCFTLCLHSQSVIKNGKKWQPRSKAQLALGQQIEPKVRILLFFILFFYFFPYLFWIETKFLWYPVPVYI